MTTNIKYHKKLLMTGALLGLLSVLIGAFGAHGLKPYLTNIDSFKTGTTYQMYHALFIMILSLIPLSDVTKRRVAIFIIGGVVLFSGGIYAESILSIFDIHLLWVNLLVPVGGISLMIGWAVLLWAVYRHSASK